ncbi:MAG: tetratricopeptide repeat protein, partial [Candidatus Brocadiae bacterium]|nr:tetratricopeptide repeat protein [Candidatus Brocadiia bacterium]
MARIPRGAPEGIRGHAGAVPAARAGQGWRERIERAAGLRRGGDLAGAIRVLRSATRLAPGEHGPWIEYGNALAASGKHGAAEA